MFGVGAFYLDEALAWPPIHRNILEPDVADESGHFLAHILVHDGAQADELPLALAVYSDVLDCNIFEAHILARLEEKRRHTEMDNVEVAQGDIAHVSGPALVAEQEYPRPVATEDRILHRDSLDVAVPAAEIEALEGDAIVVAADEAIRYQHILGVARVDAVVVLDAGVAELDVADSHPAAVPGHDGPMGRAAKRNVADFDVGTVANRDQAGDGGFAPF